MKLSTLPDDYELSDDEWDALDEEWDHITVSEATELLQQIQSGVEHIAKSGHALMLQLQQAYCRKAWEPLGLPDWQAFLDSALGNLRPHFEDAERKYVHALLKAQHMPVRAIAAVTGVGKSTVTPRPFDTSGPCPTWDTATHSKAASSEGHALPKGKAAHRRPLPGGVILG